MTDIPFDMAQRLAAEFPGLGVRKVTFSGTGEPLLHPRFADIVAIFKQAGVTTQLFTNGILLDQERSRALLEAGLDKLIVSVWAGTPEGYARCHPGSPAENFPRILDNLRRISSMKAATGRNTPEITFKHICTAHTYKEIDQTITHAYNTGCDAVLFASFVAYDKAATVVGLTSEQRKELLTLLYNARKRLDSLGKKHNLTREFLRNASEPKTLRSPACYIGWSHAKVRVDGIVMPCCLCNIVLGDINTHSLREIWNNLSYADFRIRTVTPQGQASLRTSCICATCDFATQQNLQIHSVVKWISFFK